MDPALLWPWHRSAAAVQIGPLAKEGPYATGAAFKKKKERKTKDRRFITTWMWRGLAWPGGAREVLRQEEGLHKEAGY